MLNFFFDLTAVSTFWFYRNVGLVLSSQSTISEASLSLCQVSVPNREAEGTVLSDCSVLCQEAGVASARSFLSHRHVFMSALTHVAFSFLGVAQGTPTVFWATLVALCPMAVRTGTNRVERQRDPEAQGGWSCSDFPRRLSEIPVQTVMGLFNS